MRKKSCNALLAIGLLIVLAAALALPAGELVAFDELDINPLTGLSYEDGDGGGDTTTIGGLLLRIKRIVDQLVPFIVGLAVLVILWGVFGYLTHAGEEEKRKESVLFVTWGIVGLFVMVSLWGFVNILANTFSLTEYAPTVRSVFPSLGN
ncbi:MAG: hypothetical protein AAB699_00515 [Patescibacteria group bacterium]